LVSRRLDVADRSDQGLNAKRSRTYTVGMPRRVCTADSEQSRSALRTLSRRAFGRGLAAGAAGAWALARGARRARAADPRPLGVAVVGLGNLSVGQLLPALKTTKLCRLAALVSGHAGKAKKLAATYGVSEKNIYSYETYDRMADNHDIDLVYVVLPNAMHAEYTIRAAQAGKHVLCEKPMAVSARECEQMIAASKQAKRLLAIAYRLRFEPYTRELIRLARTRELGPIKTIEAVAGFAMGADVGQWRLDKKLAGGGSLMDMGIYALQAARYISGEEPAAIIAVQTVTDPKKFRGIDETIVFSLKFPSGVVAQCSSSYATNLNRFEVNAENGRFGVDPAQWYHGIKGFRGDGKPFVFPDLDQFAAELDDFAACVRDNRPSIVPGEEGLRDLRAIEAIYRAAETGREVRLG
jgi:predicted dehydrogenase